MWMGPLTNLTHTQCLVCGGVDCEVVEEINNDDMNANPPEYYLEKYIQSESQKEELMAFVRLVATGKRSDGTYNYCREALEQQANKLLQKIDPFVTKEWCEKSAEIEGDSEIGAGIPPMKQ